MTQRVDYSCQVSTPSTFHHEQPIQMAGHCKCLNMALGQESQYAYQELYKSSSTKDCLSLSKV